MYIFVFLVSFISIGYSALNTNLLISGEANIRVPADIRITNIKQLGNINDGYETYNAEYYKDGIKLYTTLPNLNSEVTYEVEVTNSSDLSYLLTEINEITSTNENIIYTVNEIEVGDRIDGDTVKRVTVTVSYKDVSSVPTGSDLTSNITVTLNYVQDDGMGATVTTSNNNLTTVYSFNTDYKDCILSV